MIRSVGGQDGGISVRDADSADEFADGTHCGSFEPDETYPEIRGAMA